MTHPLHLATLIALLAALPLASAQLVVAKQLVFDSSVFPSGSQRPPLWSFRTLADTVSWSCTPTFTTGWKLAITHKEIPGVNPLMMKWLFQDLATGESTHPVNGQKYSNFLLMHPRDHVSHFATTTKLGATRTPFKLGAWTHWIEFPLTGCTLDGVSWVCPSPPQANPGVVQGTSEADWKLVDQVNGTSKVTTFSANAVEFGVQGCNNIGCTIVIRTRQQWKYNKKTNALQLTTTLKVGFGSVQNDPTVVDNWRNGLDPRLKCNRTALHFVEEYGALQHWLPQAYAAATQLG